METLDKEMINNPGRKEQDNTRFYYTTQNGIQSKSYKLFIFVIFHLIFSEHGCGVVETRESKSRDGGGEELLCMS
jgi:hypothetical protein